MMIEKEPNAKGLGYHTWPTGDGVGTNLQLPVLTVADRDRKATQNSK